MTSTIACAFIVNVHVPKSCRSVPNCPVTGVEPWDPEFPSKDRVFDRSYTVYTSLNEVI